MRVVLSRSRISDDEPVFALTVRAFDTIRTLKEVLRRTHPSVPHAIELYFSGRTLLDHERLAALGISDGTLVIYGPKALDASPHLNAPSSGHGVVPFEGTPWPEPLRSALDRAVEGLSAGLLPRLAVDGEGGTYFLPSTSDPLDDDHDDDVRADAAASYVACFKPRDEEMGSPLNPKRFVGAFGMPGLRMGVMSGEAYAREVAAFLLDHGSFAGVPPTALVEAWSSGFNNGAPDESPQQQQLLHRKVGSFQLFVDNATPIEDFGPGRLPASEVHKVALLDMRLLNLDRNGDNLLVQWRMSEPQPDESSASLSSSGTAAASSASTTAASASSTAAASAPSTAAASSASTTAASAPPTASASGAWRPGNARRRRVLSPFLAPIDHGYCLPSDLGVAWVDWTWLSWPQLRVPPDARFKEYVAALDAERDIGLLRAALGPAIRPACYTTLRITTLVLQRGIASGLTLLDIAECMARMGDDLAAPSVMERMVRTASLSATAAVHNDRLLMRDRMVLVPSAKFNSSSEMRPRHRGTANFNSSSSVGAALAARALHSVADDVAGELISIAEPSSTRASEVDVGSRADPDSIADGESFTSTLNASDEAVDGDAHTTSPSVSSSSVSHLDVIIKDAASAAATSVTDVCSDDDNAVGSIAPYQPNFNFSVPLLRHQGALSQAQSAPCSATVTVAAVVTSAAIVGERAGSAGSASAHSSSVCTTSTTTFTTTAQNLKGNTSNITVDPKLKFRRGPTSSTISSSSVGSIAALAAVRAASAVPGRQRTARVKLTLLTPQQLAEMVGFGGFIREHGVEVYVALATGMEPRQQQQLSVPNQSNIASWSNHAFTSQSDRYQRSSGSLVAAAAALSSREGWWRRSHSRPLNFNMRSGSTSSGIFALDFSRSSCDGDVDPATSDAAATAAAPRAAGDDEHSPREAAASAGSLSQRASAATGAIAAALQCGGNASASLSTAAAAASAAITSTSGGSQQHSQGMVATTTDDSHQFCDYSQLARDAISLLQRTDDTSASTLNAFPPPSWSHSTASLSHLAAGAMNGPAHVAADPCRFTTTAVPTALEAAVASTSTSVTAATAMPAVSPFTSSSSAVTAASAAAVLGGNYTSPPPCTVSTVTTGISAVAVWDGGRFMQCIAAKPREEVEVANFNFGLHTDIAVSSAVKTVCALLVANISTHAAAVTTAETETAAAAAAAVRSQVAQSANSIAKVAQYVLQLAPSQQSQQQDGEVEHSNMSSVSFESEATPNEIPQRQHFQQQQPLQLLRRQQHLPPTVDIVAANSSYSSSYSKSHSISSSFAPQGAPLSPISEVDSKLKLGSECQQQQQHLQDPPSTTVSHLQLHRHHQRQESLQQQQQLQLLKPQRQLSGGIMNFNLGLDRVGSFRNQLQQSIVSPYLRRNVSYQFQEDQSAYLLQQQSQEQEGDTVGVASFTETNRSTSTSEQQHTQDRSSTAVTDMPPSGMNGYPAAFFQVDTAATATPTAPVIRPLSTTTSTAIAAAAADNALEGICAAADQAVTHSTNGTAQSSFCGSVHTVHTDTEQSPRQIVLDTTANAYDQSPPPRVQLVICSGGPYRLFDDEEKDEQEVMSNAQSHCIGGVTAGTSKPLDILDGSSTLLSAGAVASQQHCYSHVKPVACQQHSLLAHSRGTEIGAAVLRLAGLATYARRIGSFQLQLGHEAAPLASRVGSFRRLIDTVASSTTSFSSRSSASACSVNGSSMADLQQTALSEVAVSKLSVFCATLGTDGAISVSTDAVFESLFSSTAVDAATSFATSSSNSITKMSSAGDGIAVQLKPEVGVVVPVSVPAAVDVDRSPTTAEVDVGTDESTVRTHSRAAALSQSFYLPALQRAGALAEADVQNASTSVAADGAALDKTPITAPIAAAIGVPVSSIEAAYPAEETGSTADTHATSTSIEAAHPGGDTRTTHATSTRVKAAAAATRGHLIRTGSYSAAVSRVHALDARKLRHENMPMTQGTAVPTSTTASTSTASSSFSTATRAMPATSTAVVAVARSATDSGMVPLTASSPSDSSTVVATSTSHANHHHAETSTSGSHDSTDFHRGALVSSASVQPQHAAAVSPVSATHNLKMHSTRPMSQTLQRQHTLNFNLSARAPLRDSQAVSRLDFGVAMKGDNATHMVQPPPPGMSFSAVPDPVPPPVGVLAATQSSSSSVFDTYFLHYLSRIVDEWVAATKARSQHGIVRVI